MVGAGTLYGGGLGSEENINVMINVGMDISEVQTNAPEAGKLVTQIGTSAEEAAKGTGTLNTSLKGTGATMDEELKVVRSLSWDFMLMGRGLSVLNHYLLGNNQVMKDAIGVIYTIGAVTRIFSAAMNILKLLEQTHITTLYSKIAALWA